MTDVKENQDPANGPISIADGLLSAESIMQMVLSETNPLASEKHCPVKSIRALQSVGPYRTHSPDFINSTLMICRLCYTDVQ
jgi:hypothetical protein